MRRAAVVIVRSGWSTRPATTQPSPVEAAAMIASAIPESMISWRSSSLRAAPSRAAHPFAVGIEAPAAWPSPSLLWTWLEL